MATILLVDDDALNRDMLARRLQRRGYLLLLALNGVEAISMATQQLPDLILMDMGMPVMNGWEATRILKSQPRTQRIPIVALTAYAMSSDQDKVLACGCDDYDSKPVDMDRLLGKLLPLLMNQSLSPSTHNSNPQTGTK